MNVPVTMQSIYVPYGGSKELTLHLFNPGGDEIIPVSTSWRAEEPSSAPYPNIGNYTGGWSTSPTQILNFIPANFAVPLPTSFRIMFLGHIAVTATTLDGAGAYNNQVDFTFPVYVYDPGQIVNASLDIS